MPSRVVGVAAAIRMECVAVGGVEGWVGPFALGFEEESEGVGANVDGVCYGIVDT